MKCATSLNTTSSTVAGARLPLDHKSWLYYLVALELRGLHWYFQDGLGLSKTTWCGGDSDVKFGAIGTAHATNIWDTFLQLVLPKPSAQFYALRFSSLPQFTSVSGEPTSVASSKSSSSSKVVPPWSVTTSLASYNRNSPPCWRNLTRYVST